MKVASLLVASTVASAAAFAPAPTSSTSSTALSESLFTKVSNLDLWAPVAKSNEYGAREKKNVKTGALSNRSYVPDGLTKAQYEKIRGDADKKKAANYERNVKKAFQFEDYTKFYMERGSDENGSWMKLPNRGHRMAKTKYDWSMDASGPNDAPLWTGVGATGKKTASKKAAAAPKKKFSLFGK